MFVRKFTRQAILTLIATTLLLAGCNVGAAPSPTLDINAISTAMVGTTIAQLSVQFTQTALAAPSSTPAPTDAQAALPTFALPTQAVASPTAGAGALPTLSFNTTPVAGFTPLATSAAPTTSGSSNTAAGCNDGMFISETLPDGSKVGPGKNFEKAWEIKNTGTCTWDEGYVFTFLPDRSSNQIEGYDIVINKADEFTKPNHSQTFVIKLTAPKTSGEYKAYWQLQTDDGTFFGPLVYFVIVVR